MPHNASTPCIAYQGRRMIAFGALVEVAAAVKAAHDAGTADSPLVFDAETSQPVELDLRGSLADVTARLPPPPPPPGRGRPKLGVVAREVTLLPRHWEWLAGQPGGASVALRKLVEDARRAGAREDAQRTRRDAAYRFMLAVAGAEEGYDEAARALFAGDESRFRAVTVDWPADITAHLDRLAERAFHPA